MMRTMRSASPSTVRPYGRLKLVGAGFVLAVVGFLRMAKGVQVVTHWTGQPTFSWGLLAAGGLCILLAHPDIVDRQDSDHALENSSARSMSVIGMFQQLSATNCIQRTIFPFLVHYFWRLLYKTEGHRMPSFQLLSSRQSSTLGDFQ
jgi:hypothetical protein